ncbi:hypothetical protein CAPTEDRAFT_170358 [Capitella teleta]|uniref:EF-hand domain-containing protein n=1 Tax=Capitella teleta TaxID=283909 RepID=R7U337_CAPTE|nr:hypothetical protein CAPTEDRAFT_170358 [Capitella teleta]|eukprot:ELU00394.1 hypothetical protein CAPTEDRAFT_170358 [Capitella teleta]
MSRGSVELTEEQISSIRECFKVYDIRQTGSIPCSKLGEVMRNLGHNLARSELKELQEAVDADQSGHIEWEEFLPLMAAKLKEKEEMGFYKNLFRMLDKKNKGFITCDHLRYILQGLSKEVDLTDDDIEDMIADVDEDKNGEVSFEEFYTLMTTE